MVQRQGWKTPRGPLPGSALIQGRSEMEISVKGDLIQSNPIQIYLLTNMQNDDL